MHLPESEPSYHSTAEDKPQTEGAREGDFRGIQSNTSSFSPSPSFSPRKMRDTWVSGATQVSTSLKGGGVQKGGRGGKRGGGKAGSREKGSPTERPDRSHLIKPLSMPQEIAPSSTW